jgi:hypothetical protein
VIQARLDRFSTKSAIFAFGGGDLQNQKSPLVHHRSATILNPLPPLHLLYSLNVTTTGCNHES